MTDLTLPHFVIIGAQKAGSTFLHHCLREHPQVYMPLDETPIFEDPFYQRRDRDWLARLLSVAGPDQRRGIKRPNFLGQPECPARMAADVPDASLIAILRNPVERAVSAYYHQILNGTAPVRPIERGLPPLFDAAYRAANPGPARIIDYGFYGEQIARFLDHFPRDRVLVLLYDDLKHDRLGIVQQVYRFVGVDDAYVPQALNDRPKASLYSIPRIRLMALRNRWLIYHIEPQGAGMSMREQNRLQRWASEAIRQFDRRVMIRLFKNPRPQLDPALAYRLYSLYAEDIARLEALLDRDLSAWRVAPPGETP